MRIHRTTALPAAFVALTLLTAAPSWSSAEYTAQQITVPGYRGTTALGMNASGEVFGTAADPFGKNPNHAFVFDPATGTTQDIGALFGRNISSTPKGFNDAGQVFGGLGNGHAFFYDSASGAHQEITLAGYRTTTALGMNASGEVFGSAVDSLGKNSKHTFVFDPASGTTRDIGALFGTKVSSTLQGFNNAGQAFGSLSNGNAFFYDSATGAHQEITLDGYRSTTALGMNASGEVFGSAVDPRGRNSKHAFVFDPASGTTQDIGALFGRNISSTLQGFNDAGQAFGSLSDGHTFFYDSATGAHQEITLDGYRGTTALGMNASGEVFGTAVDPRARNPKHTFVFDPATDTTQDIGALFGRGIGSTPKGFNDAGQVFGQLSNGDAFYAGPAAAPVPEPSTWALAMIGFFGLLVARRRFHKQAHNPTVVLP